jgi:hypothetical protein
MKIADIGIFFEKGLIYLARKNSRGHPQPGGVSVTKEILDAFVIAFENKPEYLTIYTKGDEVYKICIEKMTEEEKENRKRRSERKEREIGIMLAGMGAFFEPGLRSLKDAFFDPPRVKSLTKTREDK